MQDVASGPFSVIAENLAIVIPTLVVLIAAVVLYLVLMIRAIIDMLRHEVHGVLLTFAFLVGLHSVCSRNRHSRDTSIISRGADSRCAGPSCIGRSRSDVIALIG